MVGGRKRNACLVEVVRCVAWQHGWFDADRFYHSKSLKLLLTFDATFSLKSTAIFGYNVTSEGSAGQSAGQRRDKWV